MDNSYGAWTDPNLLFSSTHPKPAGSNYTRTLVIGHTLRDSIDWISEELPDIPVAAYVVDDLQALLHTPKNKGREATVYLTYIIENYDKLPDIVLFMHAHQYAWHNNIFQDRDAAQMIRAMRDDHIAREGYFNVRCEHNPGCPNWLHLDRPEVDFDKVFKPEERIYTVQIWKDLWGSTARVPQTLSQPCCAQFAVTRERIRLNPLTTYIHVRDWILNVRLSDHDSGRVMEYTWQYLFTRLYENCPPVNKCACSGYGMCFGSEEKMKDFLYLIYEREHREHDLKKLRSERNQTKALMSAGGNEALKGELIRLREKKEQELREDMKVLSEEITSLKDEAIERGLDEKNRAKERGRVHTEGGYW
jgi:hypothetical protein